jgi:hypothetical protein
MLDTHPKTKDKREVKCLFTRYPFELGSEK